MGAGCYSFMQFINTELQCPFIRKRVVTIICDDYMIQYNDFQ